MPESMIIMGNFLGGPDPNDKLLEGLKDHSHDDVVTATSATNTRGNARRQGTQGMGSVDLLQRNLASYANHGPALP